MSLLTLNQAEVLVEFLKVYRYGKNLKVFKRARKMPFQGSSSGNAVLRRLLRDFVKSSLKEYVDDVSLRKWDYYLLFSMKKEISEKLGYIFGNIDFINDEERKKIREKKESLCNYNGHDVTCSFVRNMVKGKVDIDALHCHYLCAKKIISYKSFLENEIKPMLQDFDILKEEIENNKESLRQERIEKVRRLREKQERLRASEQKRREELNKNKEEMQEKIKMALKDLLEKKKELMKAKEEKKKEQMKVEEERENELNVVSEEKSKEKELEQLKSVVMKSAEKTQTEAQRVFNASLQRYLERRN